MGVDIEGDSDRRVAQLLAHDRWVDPLPQQESRAAVPEVVEPDPGQAGPSNDPAKISLVEQDHEGCGPRFHVVQADPVDHRFAVHPTLRLLRARLHGRILVAVRSDISVQSGRPSSPLRRAA